MKKIFEYIAHNKDSLLKSSKGIDFEDRFEDILRKNGYSKLDSREYDNFIKSIKKNILAKESDEFFKNTYDKNIILPKSFFRTPYGSQNYPDFLIITDNYIVPIEIKYSKGTSVSPMWNSNLPKLNGIYLFGSYGKKDITFFAGSLVISPKERDDMLAFFTKLKELEKYFKNNRKNKLSDENYTAGRGFSPYVRVAFEQKADFGDTNYFEAINRKHVEEETLNILSNLE